MVLECDKKSKWERINCLRENINDDRLRIGISVLQCANETLEKSVSEVTKGKDSDINCEECVQHKHGEQWGTIDTDARNVFTCCTPSMMKCIAGINPHGKELRG